MKKNLLLIFLLLIGVSAFSQSTTISPGLILPQMTMAQRLALVNPANGILVFDVTKQSYWFRQNNTWNELPKGGSTSNFWTLSGIQGNEITNTNTGGFWSKNSFTVAANNYLEKAPATGEGTRLMWIPSLDAFRVGTVVNNFSDESTYWNPENIGIHSIAMGFNTMATSNSSVALGYGAVSRGFGSFSAGFETIADDNYTTALGYYSHASGEFSTALGYGTTAYGDGSTAMGYATYAPAIGSASIGMYNLLGGYSYSDSAIVTDRIFQVGNGLNSSNRSNALTVLRNGNVGIGNSTPAAKLHVEGYSVLNGAVAVGKALPAATLDVNGSIAAAGNVTFNSNLFMAGYIGLNTTSPIAPIHINSGSYVDEATTRYFSYGTGSAVGVLPNGTYNIGLFSKYDIVTSNSFVSAQTVTSSDARIKSIVGLSDNANDLAKLRQIQVTDYRYKDVVNRGSQIYKKVIAQQVEVVYPEAVKQIQSTIPDIYAVAEKVSYNSTTKELRVFLAKDYNLKAGEKLELVHSEKGTLQGTISDVSGNSFTIKNWPYATDKLFVFGREVNDFRTVDYEALSMLGISAVQQLAKENEDLKKKNEDLEKKLKQVERSLSARLDALEQQSHKGIEPNTK